MKKLYFTAYILLVSLLTYAQSPWDNKAICDGNSIEIGDDGDANLCYAWKATPADPTITNLKDPKISVNPSQTTTYTRLTIGDEFSTLKEDKVKVLIIKDVILSEATAIKYGYDDYTDANNIWKSVEKGASDRVNIKIDPAGGYEGAFLKSADVSKVTTAVSKATSDQFDLTLSGVGNGNSRLEVNCGKEDGPNIKKLNTKTATLKTKTVAVRLVNETGYSSTNISDADIISFLNDKCYNQAVFKWVVVRLPAKTVHFDLDGDGTINVNSWMNAEMTVIRDNCKDDSYDHNLFLVDKPSDGSTGYMQFNQRYGFIHADNSSNPPSTVAHELGHGGFGLTHTPADLENIMYNNSSATKFRLRKNQWDTINP